MIRKNRIGWLQAVLLLGALAVPSCGSDPAPSPPKLQPGAAHGLGERCLEDKDCSEGACDVKAGVCALRLREACDEHPLYCPTDSTCKPLGPAGQRTCLPPRASEWCLENEHCGAGGACRFPADALPGSRGRCTFDDREVSDTACLTHDDCSNGQACAPERAGGKACRPRGRAGEACSFDLGDRGCQAGLHCLKEGRCGKRLGDACAPGECGIGLRCDGTGRCAPVGMLLAGEGEGCADSSECQRPLQCVAGACERSAQLCATSADCPRGAACNAGTCVHPDYVLGMACDEKVSDACGTALRCVAGACRLRRGSVCEQNQSCETGACILGRCETPRDLGSPCGRMELLSSTGGSPVVQPDDSHCRGANVLCHSKLFMCVPAKSGKVNDPAGRSAECGPDLTADPLLEECTYPGPALFNTVRVHLHAVSNGNNYGAQVCLSRAELTAKLGTLPKGYRTHIFPDAWSCRSHREDRVKCKLTYEEGTDTYCASAWGKADAPWSGPNAEFDVDLVSVAYNPSKLLFLPADGDGAAAPQRPLREQLTRPTGEFNYTPEYWVPIGYDHLAWVSVWTFEPGDDDAHFMITPISLNAVAEPEPPEAADATNIQTKRKVVFQQHIIYQTGCAGPSFLETQPIVVAWKRRLTPAAERVRVMDGKQGGSRMLAKREGLVGTPALTAMPLGGTLGRGDLVGDSPFLFCGGGFSGPNAKEQRNAVCQQLREGGKYTAPYDSDKVIIEGVEGAAKYGCKKLAGDIPVLSDLCGPAVDVIGGVVKKLIDKLLNWKAGCGGRDADDDVSSILSVTETAAGANFSWQTENGNKNSATLVDLMLLQFVDDAPYHKDFDDGSLRSGKEGALCEDDSQCGVGMRCLPRKEKSMLKVCYPLHGQPCRYSCAEEADRCRPKGTDPAAERTCEAAAGEGGACLYSTDCREDLGLACSPLTSVCVRPLGSDCDMMRPCSTPSTCFGGKCKMPPGQPCQDGGGCASGNCDFVRTPPGMGNDWGTCS